MSSRASAGKANNPAAKPKVVVETKPQAKLLSTVVKQPIAAPAQVKKPDIVAKPQLVKPPQSVAAVVLGPPRPFEMTCYRGEKPPQKPPEQRLMCGMTCFRPWNVDCKNMTQLWERLRKEINDPKNANGDIPAYTQHLRASGHGYAVATARTLDGAYEYDWNYVLRVPNVRTFLWGPGLTPARK